MGCSTIECAGKEWRDFMEIKENMHNNGKLQYSVYVSIRIYKEIIYIYIHADRHIQYVYVYIICNVNRHIYIYNLKYHPVTCQWRYSNHM